jgi:hypothetical protein
MEAVGEKNAARFAPPGLELTAQPDERLAQSVTSRVQVGIRPENIGRCFAGLTAARVKSKKR